MVLKTLILSLLALSAYAQIMLDPDRASFFETDSEPTTLMYLWAENWDGSSSTFDDSAGVTFTKYGSPGKTTHAWYNDKDAIDINDIPAYFTFDTLSHNQDNYAIFIVGRQEGTTSSAFYLNFEADYWRCYIPAYRDNNFTQGLLYGQTSNIEYKEYPSGDSTNYPYIRLWLLEDGRFEFYKNGGTALLDTTFEDTALDATLRLGTASSTFIDVEICHIGIYSLPDGESFSDDFLNAKGEALEDYYNTVTYKYQYWETITR